MMMFMKCRSVSSSVLIGLGLAASALFSGCKTDFKLIDHVAFLPSDNLETVKVSLVFTENVKSDLAGGFMIKEYGYLFINPYTPAEHFEVGFSLNTSIVNDQEFVSLTPTEVLPNGMPIGLDHALAEVRSPSPINSKFDLFGYVDVLHGAWLGTAAIFSFMNDQYFPNGLTISQVFLRDAQGAPGVIATVFGPSLNNDGSIRRAGGISLFANVKQLIEHHALGPDARKVVLKPEPAPYIAGPRAPEYQGNYGKLRKLELNLVRALNQK